MRSLFQPHRFFAAVLIVALNSRLLFASGVCCAGHGSVIGCEASIAGARCSDGTVTKGCHCVPPRRKHKSLHFKTSTTRGQVLTPGEKAPTTTFKDTIKNN